MKFSEHWLREFVNPDLTTGALVEQLTMAGLEVDGVEPLAPALDLVVVGEVVSLAPHPDADRLVVCQVNNGQETVQVVCGASNVRVGIKVPFALIGATLPAVTITRARLHGVESFGMLCSERELGISGHHEGLMELPGDAPVGVRLDEYWSDSIIDLDLTPNRSDCLSMIGLARETGLISRVDVRVTDVPPVPSTIEDTFPVELAAGSACSRFAGRVIRGLDPGAESPLWLKEKLRRSGVRAIDPIVDVTNFVMLELGQPLHAYDLARLQARIIVRQSSAGETVTLLDGQEVKLDAGTLLITDTSGPIGMAGIMGGLHTAVTDRTQDIFLESAYFEPMAIAGRARLYGMTTDAAHRFERGVDWQGQSRALERATGLLLEIAGGEAGPIVETVDRATLPTIKTVTLRAASIERLLGIEIGPEAVDEILRRLEFDAVRTGIDQQVSWKISVPSHRFDIHIEADLIEEVSRVFGYNNLPLRIPVGPMTMAPRPEGELSLNQIRDQLVARGYFEAITYSFVDAGLLTLLDPSDEPLGLANPLSGEMSAMRTTLWAGLLKALQYNLNRQQNRVRLFETGLCFGRLPEQGSLKHADITQIQRLAGIACGPRQAESWADDSQLMDFYDIKGDLETILAMTGHHDEFTLVPARHPGLHPGQCADIHRLNQPVGHVGRLAPDIQQKLDIRYPVYLFELETGAILNRKLPRSTPISRFPEVRRDIALIVNQAVTYSRLRLCVQAASDETLINLKLFDVYQGKGIDPGSKSLALGLTFQHPSRTLTDTEVNDAVGRIIAHLEAELAAQLRS